MDKIELKPLEGIVINGKEIRLGASESDIKAVLGEPYSVWERSLYYFHNELRFDLGEDGTEFVEFLGGIDGTLQPTICGVSAFGTDADELYELLKRENNGDIDDRENGHSYGFLEISVGVYREISPQDVRDMIEDAEEDGEPLDEEDIAEETRRASHWNTVGVGIKDYYKRVI